jgi:hypothetical protein
MASFLAAHLDSRRLEISQRGLSSQGGNKEEDAWFGNSTTVSSFVLRWGLGGPLRDLFECLYLPKFTCVEVD